MEAREQGALTALEVGRTEPGTFLVEVCLLKIVVCGLLTVESHLQSIQRMFQNALTDVQRITLPPITEYWKPLAEDVR